MLLQKSFKQVSQIALASMYARAIDSACMMPRQLNSCFQSFCSNQFSITQ